MLEQFPIAQWAVQLSPQNWPEIYGLLHLIVEPHAQGYTVQRSETIRPDKSCDSASSLPTPMAVSGAGFDLLVTVASRPSFLLVQFGPGFDESPLASGKRTRHCLDWIDAVDRYVILIVSVEMRTVMRCASLPVRTNNDTEETAEFRHASILASNQKERQDHACPKMNSATLAPRRHLRRRRSQEGPPPSQFSVNALSAEPYRRSCVCLCSRIRALNLLGG